MPILREVSPEEAIGHALWEAHACIGQWAFCACLAMLRKALDLWSGEYRDRTHMTFNKGEHDNLYWRLQKIAVANPLYAESIHTIINGIRLDANDAVHDSSVCSSGFVGTRDGSTISALRDPVKKLHAIVVSLICTTMKNIEVIYSDESRWHSSPPENASSVIQKPEKTESTLAILGEQLPGLFSEMREDLRKNPFTREFVLLGKKWVYNADPNNPVFCYFFEEHPQLRDKLRTLEYYNLVRDIKHNDVDRFVFSEDFVKYLLK